MNIDNKAGQLEGFKGQFEGFVKAVLGFYEGRNANSSSAQGEYCRSD